MLKRNCVLFVGFLTLLYCSNIINAMDHKLNTIAVDNNLNKNFLSSNYLVNNKTEDKKLKSENHASQIVKYITKCRGKNNPYNNHALLEVIDITKMDGKYSKRK